MIKIMIKIMLKKRHTFLESNFVKDSTYSNHDFNHDFNHNYNHNFNF